MTGNIGRSLDGFETTLRVDKRGLYRLEIGWVFSSVTPPYQTIEVALNGREIGRAKIERPSAIDFSLKEAGLLRLRFPNAARPIDIGAGPDTRYLSVGLLGFFYLGQADASASIKIGQLPSDCVISEFKTSRQELASGIESLGDNCEIGMVQREFGVEPLGLFRFSTTSPEILIRALENRLVGFGTPGSLSLTLLGDRREYMVHDKLFGVSYHTWLFADQVTPEQVLEREYIRLPFLCRMFLEKAIGYGALYVFRDHGNMSDAIAEELLEKLRALGRNNNLLVVKQCDRENAADSFQVSPSGVARAWIAYRGPDWWMIADTWVGTLIRAAGLKGKLLNCILSIDGDSEK